VFELRKGSITTMSAGHFSEIDLHIFRGSHRGL
jgi:hypothetical protein